LDALREHAAYHPAVGTGSIAAVLRHQARARPDAPALTADGVTLSFAELDERANRVAQALAAWDVSAGDRVAYVGKNAPEFFCLLFGVAKLNAVTIAVNWRLAAPEVAYILADAGVRVALVGHESLALVEAAFERAPAVRVVVVGGDTATRRETFEEWVARVPAVDPGIEAAPDDVALQLYTSGTTGAPKGAMLTNRNIFAMLPVTARDWGFDATSVNLVALPLFHMSGVGWALVGFFAGAHSVLLPQVDPVDVLRVIPQFGVTHTVFVPAVLATLLATEGIEDIDFSSLRYIVYGASPISEDVLVRAIECFGCGFIQSYGLTETVGGVVHLLPHEHDPGGPFAYRLRSTGRPMEGVEVRVVEPATGLDVPAGSVGEVWLRTPRVMAGYWNQPEATGEVIDDDGWFHTGDAGYLDADGYLYINDRIKDMIISGGENVYPAEVENVLMSHDDVLDVAVIGVPSDRWGETPKALVVAAPDRHPEPADLLAYCRERLAGYKCPTSVEFVASLPRNATGKVLKREVRAPYWSQHERNVN
jgi:long-chain acyl-CoA synthetase